MIDAESTTRSSRTREQILEAARQALIRDGYERITTRRIADAARVNIATLHYYFGSKEGLLTATVRYSLVGVERQLRAALEEAPDAATALERAFATTWDIVQSQPGVLRYDLVVRGLRDDSARREANAIYAVYRRLTEEMVERHQSGGGSLAGDLTPAALAHYLVCAVDGVILHYLVSGDAAATLNSLYLIRQHVLTLLGVESDLIR